MDHSSWRAASVLQYGPAGMRLTEVGGAVLPFENLHVGGHFSAAVAPNGEGHFSTFFPGDRMEGSHRESPPPPPQLLNKAVNPAGAVPAPSPRVVALGSNIRSAFLLRSCPITTVVETPSVFFLGGDCSTMIAKQKNSFLPHHASKLQHAMFSLAAGGGTNSLAGARGPLYERGSEQQRGFHVRWVRLQSPSRQLVLKIAVKYRLHPLAVEDALAGDEVLLGVKFAVGTERIFSRYPGG